MVTYHLPLESLLRLLKDFLHLPLLEAIVLYRQAFIRRVRKKLNKLVHSVGWSSPLLLGDYYTASAAEMADGSTKGIIRVLNYSSMREEIWNPLHEIANYVEKLEFLPTFVNPRLLHNRFWCRHATLLPPHPRAFLLLPGDFLFSFTCMHAYSSIAYRLALKKIVNVTSAIQMSGKPKIKTLTSDCLKYQNHQLCMY